MKYAFEVGAGFRFQDVPYFVERFTHMDGNGQIVLFGQLNLVQKSFLLQCLVGFVPVQINTDFANSDIPAVFKLPGNFSQFTFNSFGKHRCWMQPGHGETNFRVPVCQSEHGLPGSGIDIGQQDMGYTGIAAVLNYHRKVVSKLGEV